MTKSHEFLSRPARRTILRGVGASLALPWLESLARGQDGRRQATPPRRWALLLFANGVSERDWWAKGEGSGMELSPTLQPLMPHRDQLLFLNGLRLFDRTFSPHWPFFTNLLSGKELREDTVPDVAESLDQYMARRIGRHTHLPSLHLGVEPAVPGLRLGVPGVYYSTVSWSSKNTPIPPETHPRAVFDRLFDISRLQDDRSVLDLVRSQAAALQPKLGTDDRHKLDQYLTNVRELERRIEFATGPADRGGWVPSLTQPDIARPGEKPPQDLDAHTTLMLDLLVLAFQMDKTRIATMVFENDATNLSFGFLDGVSNTPMHALSHYTSEEQLAQYRRINEFHVRKLAYVLGKMSRIDEGKGTLLDNSMILFGSNMMDGNRHDATHLPLVLCGRGGGSIRSGRVLAFEKEEDRRLCNLFVAMMNRMGVAGGQFGNSLSELPGLA